MTERLLILTDHDRTTLRCILQMWPGVEAEDLLMRIEDAPEVRPPRWSWNPLRWLRALAQRRRDRLDYECGWTAALFGAPALTGASVTAAFRRGYADGCAARAQEHASMLVEHASRPIRRRLRAVK